MFLVMDQIKLRILGSTNIGILHSFFFPNLFISCDDRLRWPFWFIFFAPKTDYFQTEESQSDLQLSPIGNKPRPPQRWVGEQFPVPDQGPDWVFSD